MPLLGVATPLGFLLLKEKVLSNWAGNLRQTRLLFASPSHGPTSVPSSDIGYPGVSCPVRGRAKTGDPLTPPPE